MSTSRVLTGLAVTGLVAAGVFGVTAPAHADLAPSSQDVVGVGSDIIQNALDFLADGDASGHSGYNTAGNKNRLVSFDATADANGRNAFLDPSLFPAGTAAGDVHPPALVSGTPNWQTVKTNTNGFPNGPKLSPTIVLRAGTSPVQRPNGGGDGLTALLNDGGTDGGLISFVRSPNLPTVSQNTTASSNLGTNLAAVKFAQDEQYIATSTSTNVPASLTAAQVWWIYSGKYVTGSAPTDAPAGTDAKAWGFLPDGSGTAPASFGANYTAPASDAGAATEIPYAEVPQNGAGVQKIFLGGLKGANGGTTPAITALVNAKQVQQNDPTTITALPSATQANALVPFPKGRYDLLGTGYFHNPNPIYAAAQSRPNSSDGSSLGNAGINLQTAAGGFKADIPYYVVFRANDENSTAGWQPGSTLNWVQTLFHNADYDADPTSVAPPFVESPAGKAIIQGLGLTPTYQYVTSTGFPQ